MMSPTLPPKPNQIHFWKLTPPCNYIIIRPHNSIYLHSVPQIPEADSCQILPPATHLHSHPFACVC